VSETIVFLSLSSAIAFGLSDFVGGVLTRRASVWAVAATSQATAAVLAVGVVSATGGDPDVDAFLWGTLAGVGSGAGNVLIFRGLAGGRMAVVAPLSAIITAALPVLVGLIMGERPGMLAITGVLIAMPAIWLVSGGGCALGSINGAGVVNGLGAGVGFGVQFSALGQIPPQAGMIPLAVSQVVSVIAIVLGAITLAAPWIPRDRFSRLGAVAGVLAGAAAVCFQLAAQYGLLTIAGVLASLYPAVTVLLAAMVLRERIHAVQALGLTFAATAVALIAAG